MNALLRISLILSCLILATETLASTFQIYPIRITLSGQSSIAVLTVRNESTEERVMQLETMLWEQKNGEDIYTPTRDILATPPIFTIPPKSSQIVRIGLRQQPDKFRELAYRLFLQEVPMATNASGEVRVALRFGIPIFIAPLYTSSKPFLNWRIMTTSDKELQVEAINRGNVHVQISNIVLKNTVSDITVAKRRGMDYLLPSQNRAWLLSLDQTLKPGSKLKIIGQTDAGEISADVVLEH